MSRNPQQQPNFRGGHLTGGGRSTPSRGATVHQHGKESPMDTGGRPRRVSGSSSRASPGPGSIYRTMPIPNQSGGAQTPSNLVRPIPQHINMSTGPSPFSPITVPKMSQSPAMSPIPFSPITVQRFSSVQSTYNSEYHSMSMLMPSSVNPVTADIIASQSQDYVDEGLAEFQDQILRLQDEQDRVQKKTFVNWINSYLQKRTPPLRIESLIDDLKDGTKLLALLEVLSGIRLPMEKGRILRRPHFLSNCNTALEFLKSKKIKLVNINASDVVDGRPAVVMGLIWTIILYFQIEENTRVLESLGQRFGTPGLYGSGMDEDDRGTPSGRSKQIGKTQERWKTGAKKALLQWCQNQVTKNFGMEVKDFGKSWRDGNAFLAIVNSIKPGVEVETTMYTGVADIDSMASEPNLTRLDTAFYVAEVQLGITRLIDPEDVDVESPDEKSIMTYVAQFLHRYPEGSEGKGTDRFGSLEVQYTELRAWLTTKIHWFEQSHLARGQAALDYSEYQKFCTEFYEKKEVYERLNQLWQTRSLAGVSPDAWKEIDTNWQKVEAQVRHWRWKLDTSLPGEFGQVGEWLNQGEALVTSDDIPSQLNEESAAVLNQKIEDHRAFFKDLASVQKQFSDAIASGSSVSQIPAEQLESLRKRLNEIGPKSEIRAVRLKFLEHKCCIVAFLTLTESKLKNWTVKYGPEDKVQQIMTQYRTFVSKNKIFQEFQKAYVEFVQVCDEYRKNGDISRDESEQIDRFTRDVADRWKKTSTELRCVQSLLEEVLTYWARWNITHPEVEEYLVRAFEMLKRDEEEQLEFFNDISVWKEKYILLQDTVAFLVATSDQAVGQDLRDKIAVITNNWEELFQYVEKYMHVGDVNRIKRDYQLGLEQLDKWLRRAETLLSTPQIVETEGVRKTLETLMQLHTEVGEMEDLFKSTSKKFQQLVQELTTDEIEDMMLEIKKEKENLVIIRSMIPSKVQLFHHLLTQLEAVDNGEKKVLTWCQEADQLVESLSNTGSLDHFQSELNRCKPVINKIVTMQAMTQSTNNVFQSILKSTEDREAIDTTDLSQRIEAFNQKFIDTLQAIRNLEMRFASGIKCWETFATSQKSVDAWIREARNLLAVRHIDSMDSVDQHRRFFQESSIDQIMQTYLRSAQELESYLDDKNKGPVGSEIRKHQEAWSEIKSSWPLHMKKVEFRLDEEMLDKYLQEVETQLLSEGQALQRGEDVSKITEEHTEFFASSALVEKIEACLDNLAQLANECKQYDPSLLESHNIYKTRWNNIKARVENIFGQLEQIPEHWRLYKQKFDEMSEWLDTVEKSLNKVFTDVTSHQDFVREKDAFQNLCQDMDNRREDMKWLVQRLDQLVAQRADEGGLIEQKRLEQLITRYKGIIPMIETTMQKIDIYSKCYAYRDEVAKEKKNGILVVLEAIEKKSLQDDRQPESEDAIEKLIEEQENLIQEQETNRSSILSLLQRGKDLLRDPNCPPFLRDEVAALESKWNDCCRKSINRLNDLKEHARIWMEYKKQRDHMLNLINEAEEELDKIIPRHSHQQIKEDLAVKHHIREEVQKATEDILSKMKELSETLQSVASSEQQDTFSKEVLELEARLTKLLDECDKKIKNLEDLHVKWTNFNQGLDEIKNWVGSAKMKLNEILTLDLSPEDRVKMTLELHNQVQARIKQLEKMENEIQDFSNGSEDVPEITELRSEVDAVKGEVKDFQSNVEEHTCHASKDLKVWEQYMFFLGQFRPWLEQAEVKVEVGFGKPSSLQDARTIKKGIEKFSSEIDSKKENLNEIKESSKEVINKNLDSEVDALHSRWQAVRTSVTQWQQKIDQLIASWTSFEKLKDELSKWIGEQEKMLLHVGDPKLATPETAAPIVESLKQLCDQISNKQVMLISLTEEGDKVAFHLSPDMGGTLKADVTDMKRRVVAISEESRQRLSELALVLDSQEQLQSKIKEFKNWLDEFGSIIQKNNEIPVNKIEESLEKVYLMSQQHTDKQTNVEEMKENISHFKQDHPYWSKYQQLVKLYNNNSDLLQNRIIFLKLWSSFWSWHEESISTLDHLAHTLQSSRSTLKELEVVAMELDNLAVQCHTRQVEGEDETKLAASCNICIVDKSKPITITNSVANVTEKIRAMKKSLENKEKGLQNVEAQWDSFKEAEKKLAEWLQVVLREVQKISVRESTVDALKDAAKSVGKLAVMCQENTTLKETYERIGKELMIKDQSQAKVIQDAISEANMKWEKVSTLLREQQTKSQALIKMWENCNELKANLVIQLNISQDIYDSLGESRPSDPGELAEMADKCKKAIDNLKKVRHPFEMYYKKQTQLIQELQTVPAFDVVPLKQELQEVQQKFSYLGTNLKGKMNGFDSQIVICRQVQQAADEIFSWLRDIRNQMTMALTNISDVESAKSALQKYKSETPHNMNLKAGIENKVQQLTELIGEGGTLLYLEGFLEAIADEMKDTHEVSLELESAVYSHNEKSKEVKDSIKDSMDFLSELREKLIKCDDNSGTDEEILQRLQNAKEVQTALDEFEMGMESIENQIKDLKDTSQSYELNNIIKDYANLEKKFDMVSSQCNKITTCLYGLLEKHYIDRVQAAMKFVSSCRNKIQWCIPEKGNDRFSLESKLDSAEEISQALDELDNLGQDLQTSAKILLEIVDEDKALEINNTVQCLDISKEELQKEIHQTKITLSQIIEMWNDFEKSMEQTSSELRRMEEEMRQFASQPISMDMFSEAQSQVLTFESSLQDIANMINEAEELSMGILEVSPDVKIQHFCANLRNRHQVAKRGLEILKEKLKNLSKCKDSETGAFQAFRNWLENSKLKLKPFEDLSKIGDKQTSDDKMQKLKEIIQDKTNGNKLLETAIDESEKLFSFVSSEDRDKIRIAIKTMRDDWEAHIDYMNLINKQVASISMSWTSFDESVEQLQKWFESLEKKLKESQSFGTIFEKKIVLQNYRGLLQDIDSHNMILQNLDQRAAELKNEKASNASKSCQKRFKDLKAIVTDHIAKSETSVSLHEEYNKHIEKMTDLILRSNNELLLIDTIPTESEDACKRLEILDRILLSEKLGSSILGNLSDLQIQLFETTSPKGRDTLNQELVSLSQQWNDLISKASDFKVKLQSASKTWTNLKREIQQFSTWLEEEEGSIKDQEFRKDAKEKQDHLEHLKCTLKEISSKGSILKSLTDRARETGTESDVSSLISDLNCNYNNLRKNCADAVGKYEGFVKEHTLFDDQYSEFVQWIKMISEDLPQYNEITGDLKVLQDRKNGIVELEDLRNNESLKFESILELGEKLYAHTSQDGREEIRQQLKKLRSLWEKITQDITDTSTRVDKCLQQFSDLTSLQEQLTKWLKDIETAMHHHTELRPSLQEKKCQLQSHKQIHQEITTHNSLVDAVCNKAKELVDQTQDKSLNAYIESIKNLFRNIGLKSKDLSDKLQTCVADHSNYSMEVNSFKDFAASQSELLTQCADVTGEKTDLEHKAQILNELKQNKLEGDKKLVRLDELCSVVCKSTAPKGAHRLRQALQEMKESWGTHTLLIDDIEINIEKALAQWKQFNDDMIKHGNWFKQYEDIFHSQTPQGTLDEKEDQLKNFLSKRNDIIQFESNIDDFVNNSHNLLQNTGTERLKTTIMQINNRYQLLHVLSKDVCARWQGIVEEHQNFEEKMADTKKWLRDLEDTMERAVKEINVELKSDMLQSIVAEQETAPVKIHAMFAYAEQLYPDTSSLGRETIRQELKALQQRWDNLLEKAENFQKKLDSQLQSWSTYQESLSEANNWLSIMDAGIKLDHINWLSLQESKSRLLKMKSAQQEINSHKRFIELVNEKGAAVVQANPHAAAEEVQGAIESINDKYDELQENVKKNVTMLENVIESIQHHQDLKKTFQDWQKDMWDKLSMCTDYSGNKIILEKRLAKLAALMSAVSEGEQHLKNISSHIEGMGEEQMMPTKAKDALEKDLQNLKFDFEKFLTACSDVKQNVQGRLNQWVEYDHQHEKLVTWINDCEANLKTYNLRASLEEKVQQFDRFQDMQRVVESKSKPIAEHATLAEQLEQSVVHSLRQSEPDLDKLSEEGSDISQLGGETRISINVQQIASRYRGIQSAVKEILKRSEFDVSTHKLFDEKYQKFSTKLAQLQEAFLADSVSKRTQEGITEAIKNIEGFLRAKPEFVGELNALTELCEKLYNSTSQEGREFIRGQISDIQQEMDSLFDKILQQHRELEAELSKWKTYEESSANLSKWLQEMNQQFKNEIILKATLDEKKAQLQAYRTALQEIKGQKPAIDDLKDKLESLPQKPDNTVTFIDGLLKKHKALQDRVQDHVSKYEAFVTDHSQYTKAVMETCEWLMATSNTIEMWGDTSLERLSLHANLERLKNLQLGLPEEEYRTNQIKSLGEKVMPGTVEHGKTNIKIQIDTTSQDWQGLQSALQSTIEAIEQKIKQWGEYEAMKEECLLWLRDTDTKLHMFDLKATLPEKNNQLEELRTIQGLVRAKELEIDALTDKTQNLYKGIQSMRNTHLTELTVKYQNIVLKVKDLIQKWQSYVNAHSEFELKLNECQLWISQKSQKLSKALEMSMVTQSEVDAKIELISDLLVSKDEGFKQIQNTIELAQAVLANTSPNGHKPIKDSIDQIQEDWNKLASKMAECKVSIDDSIQKWAGFLDQLNDIEKTLSSMEKTILENPPEMANGTDIRNQIDRLKNQEEKMKNLGLEIENIKLRVESMSHSSQGADALSRGTAIIAKHSKLLGKIQDNLADYENQLKHYKTLKVAQDSLVQYLQRCRDKLQTMKQRSPNDKNYVDAITQGLDHLLNKEAQGQIIVEQLTQAGEILLSKGTSLSKEKVEQDIATLNNSFVSLFDDVKQQRKQMGLIMNIFRDFKDETERLTDWLQQVNINIKAAKTSLLSTLQDKEKAVQDMEELNTKLSNGKKDIEKYIDMANKMRNSCLEANVMMQQRDIYSKYQVTCSIGLDILKKVQSVYQHHYEYQQNVNKARNWMEEAWNTIRKNTVSEGKSKEDLHGQLDNIRDLLSRQEDGQSLVNAAVDWGEKTVRNTRSDGKDKIILTMKDLQLDWEKLVKKMSSAKVTVETDLLQWSDAQQSMSRLQEWINDREKRLKQAAEHKNVMITRRSTLGISTLSVSERTATLRQTNSILQDIQAFEPMIKTVASTSSAEVSVSEIATKYQNLSKQAQELYDKEKEMVDKHELFMEAGNDFMSWLRIAKEKLAKCSEPTGDKDSLANKVTQIRILESEKEEGERKLEESLRTAADACSIALEEDRDIVEEEVAFLQDEFDQFTEHLSKTKFLLEGGIVRWTEYQDMYHDALSYLERAEKTVNEFNKYQSTLTEKRKALEDFQVELQKIFDWQKDLDLLNRKGQSLLEICADSRVSNAITQLTTKYQALISLAKDVIRRLEIYFQEHHQHSALVQDCQAFIDKTRMSLQTCHNFKSTPESVSEKLRLVRDICQSLEQGQNKLRYAMELKERVILNTDKAGCTGIEKETADLKVDFEKLILEIQDIRTKLTDQLDVLGNAEKSNKMLLEWIDEAEQKLKNGGNGDLFNDLAEKRAALERTKTILRDLELQDTTVSKLSQNSSDQPSGSTKGFTSTIERFNALKDLLLKNVSIYARYVQIHESYQKTFNEASDSVRRVKLELQQCSDSHGERKVVEKRQKDLKKMIDSFPELETAINDVFEESPEVLNTTGEDGKDVVKQDNQQLKYEWDQLKSQATQSMKTIDKCITAWNEFESAHLKMSSWITSFQKEINNISDSELKTNEGLDKLRKLLKDANIQKYEMENLNDKCEVLMEYSACSHVRDLTVNAQATYSNLYTTVQSMFSKAEKSVTDFTDFFKSRDSFEDWYSKASGTMYDFSSTEASREVLQTNLNETKNVIACTSEGQHLLNCVNEAFTQVAPTSPDDEVRKMREITKDLRSKFDTLNVDLAKNVSILQTALQRWSDFDKATNKISDWIKHKQIELDNFPQSRGEIGEMKTFLERLTSMTNDILKEKINLETLLKEANALSSSSSDNRSLQTVKGLQDELSRLEERCKGTKDTLQKEIDNYAHYYQLVQIIEKWLLQMSFQLMAHNSLYITTKEQAIEQMLQHDSLMSEIHEYQSTIDDARSKGNEQISKYVKSKPSIKQTLEKQHQNIQESFNSLLQTGAQIKNRLQDSIAKFNEYEETLDSIGRNLDKWEKSVKESSECQDNVQQLEQARHLYSLLQSEKSRLVTAIQACEAATASVSRPGSPLTDQETTYSEKELNVKAKLEDLIEQVHSQISGCLSKANELEDIDRMKSELETWIEKKENEVAKLLHRPAKLRPDAAQLDINFICDFRQTVQEKHSSLEQLENRLRDAGVDSQECRDLTIKLDTLDEHIGMLLEKRYRQQSIVEDYKSLVQDAHGWMEKTIRSLEELDSNSNAGSQERATKVCHLAEEFETIAQLTLTGLKDKSDSVYQEVGEMDGQQVQEQMTSLERRINDLRKRIERKKQLVEMAATTYDGTKKEIDQALIWVKEKMDWIQKLHDDDFGEDFEDNVDLLRNAAKEAETRRMTVDALSNKVHVVKADVSEGEFESLLTSVGKLSDNHAVLIQRLKEMLEEECEGVQRRKKFQDDYDGAVAWIKVKSSEHASWTDSADPLRSHAIELKIAKLKKAEGEIKLYEEEKLSKIKREMLSFIRREQQDTDGKVEDMCKELESSAESVKTSIKEKISNLEKKLEPRRMFESDLEKCTLWLNRAESVVSSEIRGTVNIATLDQQLHKFKALRQEEDEYRVILARIVETGNGLMPSLNDADRLTLQNSLDEVCDKMNRVADTAKNKIDDLVQNIQHYRKTAQKIEQSVAHLSTIQQEIRQLNKPIGYRVEDAEDVLSAYEKILADLKDFKAQLEELHRTTGANVNELKALLKQQEDLILAIENQMVKIKTLINVRHQFMTLVTGITGFIISYTEVVKEVERSSQPSEDKVRKYDEAIRRIDECDTQLALACDKGQQIASEASAQDRNKITEQLQSLKTQIHTLKKAIERKRAEHVESAAEYAKLSEELEAIMQVLLDGESVAKSRPLLGTGVKDVETKIRDHDDNLSTTILSNLEKIKSLKAELDGKKLPSQIKGTLSSASALISSLPGELEERRQYLERNKEFRLQYDSFVERLNSWVEEAQIKLRTFESGIDFQNLEADLEEHKVYFRQETKLRDLLSKIHEIADKIRPSLDGSASQEKLRHEEEFFNQLVKNTLNSAHSRQAEFEENLKRWKAYRDLYEQVLEMTNNLAVVVDDSTRPTTLTGIKSAISRNDSQSRVLREKKKELDTFNDVASSIESLADTVNRHRIHEEQLAINKRIKDALGSLKDQKESLATIALQWDDFDTKFKSFSSILATQEHKASSIDMNFVSISQMQETKSKYQSILKESHNLDTRHRDVLVLSKNVMQYLGSDAPVAKTEMDENVAALSERYKKFLANLEAQITRVTAEISNLESVEKSCKELQDKLNRLQKEVTKMDVWAKDQLPVAEDLKKHRSHFDELMGQVKHLSSETRSKYEGQSLTMPTESNHQLSSLEIFAENLSGELSSKESDFGRAGAVRTEFNQDMEEVQLWLQRSDARVQDRSLLPHTLKDQLSEVSSEISGITEKLSRLHKNGQLIVERTHNFSERDLVQSTCTTLTDQLDQLQNLLQRKKSAVGNAIDAWDKFLELHESVMVWCSEKKALVEEPLEFDSLGVAKSRLQTFGVGVKSIAHASKNIQEMTRELSRITESANSGNLPEKMTEAEHAKADTECQLNEKNAMLMEMVEEWDQCEKKLKATQLWIQQSRHSLEDSIQKERPLRDQLSLREKMLSEIPIQKRKVSMALEKLQVHFGRGRGLHAGVTGSDSAGQDVKLVAEDIYNELGKLTEETRNRCSALEACLAQIDHYQKDIYHLQQQILQQEQQLRAVSGPSYVAKNRDRAMAEQSACREKLRGFQSKITAFNERMKLLNQKGTPDETRLVSE